MEIDPNEIRDYLNRAPKRREIRKGGFVNNTSARFVWLAALCSHGTLHERINRRAGIVDVFRPYTNPVWKACDRHLRKQLKRTSQGSNQ